jgi:hypothetical protein
MAHYWLKLYTDILDDPKMGTLPDILWRRAVELFLIAKRSNSDGALPPVDEIAWILRSTPKEVEQQLHDLAARTEQQDKPGIVHLGADGLWIVTNFAKRQQSLGATERKRRQRERDVQSEADPQEAETASTPQGHEFVTKRDTDQIREDQTRAEDREGAQAPPPSQPAGPARVAPKRKKRRSQPPPPALARFRKATNAYPRKSLWDGIVEVVGDDADDLDRWEQTCRAYIAMGWNPRNVKGMLEHYVEHRIPGDDRKATARASPVSSEPAGFEGIREWLREKDE